MEETMIWPRCPDCDSNDYVELRDSIASDTVVRREWVCEDCQEPFRTFEEGSK